MHCVPYKALEASEELNAVAALSSALQTAQLACNQKIKKVLNWHIKHQ